MGTSVGLVLAGLAVTLGMGITSLVIRDYPAGGGRMDTNRTIDNKSMTTADTRHILSSIRELTDASEELLRQKTTEAIKWQFAVKKQIETLPPEEAKAVEEDLRQTATLMQNRYQKELEISEITSPKDAMHDKSVLHELKEIFGELLRKSSTESEKSKKELEDQLSRVDIIQQRMTETRIPYQNGAADQERSYFRGIANRVNSGTATSTETTDLGGHLYRNRRIDKTEKSISDIIVQLEILKRGGNRTLRSESPETL